MSNSRHNSGPSDAAGFAPTRWTLVLAAAGKERSSQVADALAELCGVYWYPLYAYLRRRGYDAHAAEDLTQEFFAQLLANDALQGVAPSKGKFRSFLLAAVKHLAANQWDRSQAKKRGGGQAIVSLDTSAAENRFQLEPAHELTPERLFERQWALTVLEQTLARLRAEFTAAGKASLFDGLHANLTADRRSVPYAQLALALGMTEGAVKMEVHRMRRRYRQLLRNEISQTVADPDEIDEEIRYLLSRL